MPTENQIAVQNVLRAVGLGSKTELDKEDIAWLRNEMERITGSRNFEEANRRYLVYHEWSAEQV